MRLRNLGLRLDELGAARSHPEALLRNAQLLAHLLVIPEQGQAREHCYKKHEKGRDARDGTRASWRAGAGKAYLPLFFQMTEQPGLSGQCTMHGSSVHVSGMMH